MRSDSVRDPSAQDAQECGGKKHRASDQKNASECVLAYAYLIADLTVAAYTVMIRLLCNVNHGKEHNEYKRHGDKKRCGSFFVCHYAHLHVVNTLLSCGK